MLLMPTVLVHVAFIDGKPRWGENVIFIACLFFSLFLTPPPLSPQPTPFFPSTTHSYLLPLSSSANTKHCVLDAFTLYVHFIFWNHSHIKLAFLCLSLCVSLSVCLSVCLSLSLLQVYALCASASVCVCVCVCVCLCVCMCVCMGMCVCVWVWVRGGL